MLNKGLKPVLYDKDKAVSPIIATILLVAITVILASTLYLALGGFFSHTTTASPTVTVGATNQTVSTGHGYEYVLSFGTPTSTVPLSDVILKVTLSSGVVISSPALSNNTHSSFSGAYSTIDLNISTVTGNLGPSLTVTIQPTALGSAYGVTSIQVVDTGPNGGVMGTASVS